MSIRVMSLFLTAAVAATLYGCSKREETAGGVRIRYADAQNMPLQIKFNQKLVGAFTQANPDIHIDYEVVHGGPQKILVETAGNSAPDVFFWWDDLLGSMVNKRAVLDLTSFIEKDKDFNLDEFFPATLKPLTFDGRLYGLPVNWSTMVMFYNKTLFDKAGVEYPDESWTWDDFLATATKLTVRKDGRVIQYGAIAPDPFLAIYSFGGRDFNEDATKCTIDSRETRQALQFLLDLQNKHKVVPSAQEIQGGGAWDKMRFSADLFRTGRVAMFIQWPAPVEQFARQIKSFDWDIAFVPRKSGRSRVTMLASSPLCISSQSKNPQAAWEFIKFACGYEGGKMLAQDRRGQPPFRAAFEKHVSPPPEHIHIMAEQVDSGVSYASSKKTWAAEFRDKLFLQQLDRLFLGMQDIDRTVANIKADADKFLKGE
ncbi:MAG: sugar ABC transporter substrate-binding protein [Armatimonadetes bacterium]|nr:sugar ABC transporter substrate-binding protein [Armatimonadota bacterium]